MIFQLFWRYMDSQLLQQQIIKILKVTRPAKAKEEEEPEISDMQKECARSRGAARGGKTGSVNGNVHKEKAIHRCSRQHWILGCTFKTNCKAG